MKRGWANRQDAIDFAVQLLVDAKETDDIAVIAAGEDLSDDELFRLIAGQASGGKTDSQIEIDK